MVGGLFSRFLTECKYWQINQGLHILQSYSLPKCNRRIACMLGSDAEYLVSPH